MKQVRLPGEGIFIVGVLLATLLLVGCETNSGVSGGEAQDADQGESSPLIIEPRSAIVHLEVVEVYYTTSYNEKTGTWVDVRNERDLGPEILSLEVQGGRSPLRWQLRSDIGQLTTHGNRATFMPTKTGGTYAVVTDSRKNTASIEITVNKTLIIDPR